MSSNEGAGGWARIRRWGGRDLNEGLHGLCALGIGGLATELALTRHWQKWTQGLVWLFLALLIRSWWILRPFPSVGSGPNAFQRRRAMRLAAVVAGGGLLGILLHVSGNLSAGPLDAVYGRRWDGLPFWQQLLLAVTMRVGPAPALASGALPLLAGMLWLLARVESE